MRKKRKDLTKQQKEELIKNFKNGFPIYSLTIMYGITERAVYNIIKKDKDVKKIEII